MQSAALKEQQNYLVYFYDLPKSLTSVQIAEEILKKTGINVTIQPQIKRDLTRHFYTAIVKLNNSEEVNKVKEELRYPEFITSEKGPQGGEKKAHCRALAFNPDFMGAGKLRMVERNTFVKCVPKEMTAADLHKEFEKYGSITSVKISLDENHNSNGYGFVCFDQPQSVLNAIEATRNSPVCQAMKFQQKEKRDQQKAFNNLYVKNFPQQWEEAQVRSFFSGYGDIASCVLSQTELGEEKQVHKFAFVCFGDTAEKKGFECASKAAQELHNKEIEGQPIYVKQALSKKEREVEKIKSMIRYKNSKKRCNLYVKNFPPTTTAEELQAYFSKYGETESIRVFPKEGEAVYAFVCFKRPEEAQQAKAACHNQNFNGKQLIINYYEIKEQRQIQYEEFHDKLGFQNYKKQSTNYTELMSRPDIYALLEQLITVIQPKLNRQNQQRRPMGQAGPGGQMRQPHPGQMPKGAGYPPQGRMQGGMPQPGMAPGGMPPGGMPPATMMPPPQMPMNPTMQPVPQHMAGPNPQMQNLMMRAQGNPYLQKTLPIINAVVPQNPNLKQLVGECIYEFVEQIAGPVHAPKITGMLIDLPIEEVRNYMMDPNKFEEKVREAAALLTQQDAAAAAAQRQNE